MQVFGKVLLEQNKPKWLHEYCHCKIYFLHHSNHYRPQRSCGQGYVLHVSVILVHRGEGVSGQGDPPDQAEPPDLGRTPLDQAEPPQTKGEPPQDQGEPPGPGRPPRPGRTPPDQDSNPPIRENPPGPRENLSGPGFRHTPLIPMTRQYPPGKQTPEYGLRAVGTHPTGMHSCCCCSHSVNEPLASLYCYQIKKTNV